MKIILLNLVVPLALTLSSFYLPACKSIHEPEKNMEETRLIADSVRYFDSLVNVMKISDPRLARSVAMRALSFVQANNDVKLNARVWLIAGIAFHLTAPDSAYSYYQRANTSAAASGSDTIIPRILYNIAMLHKIAGNYQEAVILLDSAKRAARVLNDYVTLSNCCNSLGNIEADLHNEEQAVGLFAQSLQIARDHNMPNQIGVALASLSRFETDASKAYPMRREALTILMNQPGASEQTGYLLANIGDDCRDPDSAIICYRQAREIGKKGRIVELELACLNNMAYSYAEKGDLPTALRLLNDTAVPLALEVENNSWLSTLYDSDAELVNQSGNPAEAYRYQKMALDAATIAERDRASNQVRLLNALLHTRAKEMRILEQTSKIERQNRQVRSLNYFVVGLVAMAVLMILFFIVYRLRKNIRIQRLELESAKIAAEIENQEKERLSMQLHDMIRPVKSAISNHIENLEFKDLSAKDDLVNSLEKITGSLRQLSHRMNPVIRSTMGFSELCEGIRQDFSHSGRLFIRMEVSPPDLRVTPGATEHIYFILYELLTNAEKHLGNGNVSISISEEFENLYILYKDDGKGFDQNKTETPGLGVTLIKKRVLLMGGHADLRTDNTAGTRWTITLPGKGNIQLT